jgi:CRISPR/Cas system-associated exonuclease Cas4 (RecB family)
LNTTQILKTPEVLNRIHEFLDKPLSASAVNKYMICPLDYYYRYLVEFGEDKEVEEEIENNTFGSIIHKTLEDLFKPYAQRDKQGVYVQPAPPPVREKDVLKMLDTFKSSLYSGFLDHFGQDESLFKTGKNRLSYEMAIEITKNVLKKELEFIQGLKEPLYIEQIEAEMHTEILVPFEQGTRTLHFKGYIDRIDRIGNRYRVIDYKTGKVKKEQVVYSTLAKGLIPSFLKSKHAFQLALYCMFFKDKYGVLPDEAKIASLINVNEDFNLTVKDGSLADMIPVVHELLGEILVQMFDETQPFEHQPDSDYCQYCS